MEWTSFANLGRSFRQNLFRRTAMRLLGVDLPFAWKKPESFGSIHLESVEIFHRGMSSAGSAGFGASLSAHLAPVIAGMEALESLALADSNVPHQSRSGAAAHFDLQKARESAYSELIERDAFLFHWLTETPGDRLPIQEENKTSIALGLYSIVDVQVTQLQSADPSLCVAMASVPTGLEVSCICIGLGVGQSLPEATLRAAKEASVQAFGHVKTGQCPAQGLAQTKNANSAVHHRRLFSDHHLSTQNSLSRALIERLTGRPGLSSDQHLRRSLQVDIQGAHFRTLKTRSNHYYAVLATHPRLLPIYFGDRYRAQARNYRQLLLRQGAPLKKAQFHKNELFLTHPLD